MSDAINPDHYKRLPAEAIEIIEAMIAGAPDNKAAYLHGQAAKYDLRLWGKGKSIEDYLTDWQKHIWYALRLESHLLKLIEKQKADEQQKAADIQSLKDYPFGKLREPVVKQSLTTELPDGWRWLEIGEVIRKGDRYFDGDKWKDRDWAVKETYSLMHQKTIRRNRFEVGEKVVHVPSKDIMQVVAVSAYVSVVDIRNSVSHYPPEVLAPYIEDAT